MHRFLNLPLMSHPANWAMVTLMVLIAALSLDLLTKEKLIDG